MLTVNVRLALFCPWLEVPAVTQATQPRPKWSPCVLGCSSIAAPESWTALRAVGDTMSRRLAAVERSLTSEKFPELFRRHYGLVRAVVKRRGVPESAADDVLQETFLTAFRRRSTLRQLDEARPWLATIAVHCALNWTRGNRRADRKRQAFAAGHNQLGMSREPSDRLVRQAAVRKYLESLSDEKVEALVFTEVFGMTAREISLVAGVKESTVRSRISSARADVRRLAQTLDARDTAALEASISRVLREAHEPPEERLNAAWIAFLPCIGGFGDSEPSPGSGESTSAAPCEAACEIRMSVPASVARNGVATSTVVFAAAGALAVLVIGGAMSATRSDTLSVKNRASGVPTMLGERPVAPAASVVPARVLADLAEESVHVAKTSVVPTAEPSRRTALPEKPGLTQRGRQHGSRENERSLLRRALKAEQGQAFGDALNLAVEHRNRFPASALGSVAAGLHLRALCGLERFEQANKVASRYARRKSTSAAVPRALNSPQCARARRVKKDQ